MPTDTSDQGGDGSSVVPDSKVCVLILRLSPYPRQERQVERIWQMKTAWGQSRNRRSGEKREEKAAEKLRVLRKTLAGGKSILQTALQRFSPSLKTPLTEKHSNVF